MTWITGKIVWVQIWMARIKSAIQIYDLLVMLAKIIFHTVASFGVTLGL